MGTCYLQGHEVQVILFVLILLFSKVCLVYLNSRSNPTIWLADDELKWHYLTDKFKQYFQMAIVHLGLPYWQFCFTPQGIPSWVEVIIAANHYD